MGYRRIGIFYVLHMDTTTLRVIGVCRISDAQRLSTLSARSCERVKRISYAMAKRFWRTIDKERNEVSGCAWCDRTAIFQELNTDGKYVGACKDHKDKLKPLTDERKYEV